MTLVDLVLEVHRQLDSAGSSHAFGGALALGYVAEPRGTVDVDINVFTPLARIDGVLDALAGIRLRAEDTRDKWVPVAGIRLRRHGDPYPVDLFPSIDEHYAAIERRRVQHPFGPDADVLPFLSPEDLVLFKLSFGRDKDWVDLRAIAAVRPDLDLDYVEAQLVGMRGPTMNPRVARFRRLLRTASS